MVDSLYDLWGNAYANATPFVESDESKKANAAKQTELGVTTFFDFIGAIGNKVADEIYPGPDFVWNDGELQIDLSPTEEKKTSPKKLGEKGPAPTQPDVVVDENGDMVPEGAQGNYFYGLLQSAKDDASNLMLWAVVGATAYYLLR